MVYRRNVGSCEVASLEIASSKRTAEEVAALFSKMSTSTNAGEAGAAGKSAPGRPAGGDVAAAVGAGVTWSYNLLLFRFGGHVILVDTGFGFDSGGPGLSTGELLSEAGIAAEDLDMVIITHCHGDHIGGLSRGGERSFPNAEVVVSRPEMEYWVGTGPGAPDASRAEQVRSAFAPYEGRQRIIDPGEVLFDADGVRLRTLHAPGHTPGQIALELSSGGRELLALADTIHTTIQVDHPEWSPNFDVDPVLSVDTRRRLFRSAAQNRQLIHLYHLAFPGFGRISDSGGAFAWHSESN